MMTTEQRLTALANLVGVRRSQFSTPYSNDNQFEPQVNVFIDAPSGRFRVGYFDGNTFFRENPVSRAIRRRGIRVREGLVGKDSEPQYDMVFIFDNDGKVVYVSDGRTSQEAVA